MIVREDDSVLVSWFHPVTPNITCDEECPQILEADFH